jgi:bifunctional non-homologous end joining protein LigD
VVHRHKTGRTHYDLRIVFDEVLRSWSLLREPPRRPGDRKLAIEREKFTVESMNSKRFEEEAFGLGRVDIWDEGEVEVRFASLRFMTLIFSGSKISGEYQLRRMRWYPGNRWLLKKMRDRGIL